MTDESSSVRNDNDAPWLNPPKNTFLEDEVRKY